MATEVVKIVDPGGTGDYTSLSAFVTGEARDLVTADEISVAKCRCTNGNADSSAVTVDGFTTDSTHYVKIWTDPSDTGGDGRGGSYRHLGIWPSSGDIYRLSARLYISDNYVYVDGLAAKTSVGVIGGTIYVSEVSGIKISNCYLENTGTGSAILFYQSKASVWNVIGVSACGYKYEHDSCGVFLAKQGACTVHLYNCTGISIGQCYGIFESQYGDVISYAYNCIGESKGGYYTNGACYVTSSNGVVKGDYNISDDTSAPGDNSIHSVTLTYKDKSNKDFHLSSSDTDAIDSGMEDPGSGLYDDDIDGDSRPQGSGWDIGADEFVVTVTIMSANPASYTLSTKSISALLNHILSVNKSEYSISAEEVDILLSLIGIILYASPSEYSVLSEKIDLLVNRILPVGASEYLVSAEEISTLLNLALQAGPSEYSIYAEEISALLNRILLTDKTDYTISAEDISTLLNYVLPTLPSEYSISAKEIEIILNLIGLILLASPSEYSISAEKISAIVNRIVSTDKSDYIVSTMDIGTLLDRVVSANSAIYVSSLHDLGTLIDHVAQADASMFLVSADDLKMLTDRLVSVSTAGYSVYASNSDVLANRLISLQSGIYEASAKNSGLLVGLVLPADVGSFSLQLNDSDLSLIRTVLANPASINVTGFGTDLTYTPLFAIYTLNADPAGITLSTEASSLIADRIMNQGYGEYFITGESALTLANAVLNAAFQQIDISPSDTRLITLRKILADPGYYNVTGTTVDIIWSGEVAVVKLISISMAFSTLSNISMNVSGFCNDLISVSTMNNIKLYF